MQCLVFQAAHSWTTGLGACGKGAYMYTIPACSDKRMVQASMEILAQGAGPRQPVLIHPGLGSGVFRGRHQSGGQYISQSYFFFFINTLGHFFFFLIKTMLNIKGNLSVKSKIMWPY